MNDIVAQQLQASECVLGLSRGFEDWSIIFVCGVLGLPRGFKEWSTSLWCFGAAVGHVTLSITTIDRRRVHYR